MRQYIKEKYLKYGGQCVVTHLKEWERGHQYPHCQLILKTKVQHLLLLLDDELHAAGDYVHVVYDSVSRATETSLET